MFKNKGTGGGLGLTMDLLYAELEKPCIENQHGSGSSSDGGSSAVDSGGVEAGGNRDPGGNSAPAGGGAGGRAAAAACIGDGGGHGGESQNSDSEEDLDWKSMAPAELVMNPPDAMPKALNSAWHKAWEAKVRVDCLKRIGVRPSLQATAKLSADAAAADFAAAYTETA